MTAPDVVLSIPDSSEGEDVGVSVSGGEDSSAGETS